MLSWLYKNWAYTNILIALYSAIILCSSHAQLPYFTFLIWMQFPVYLLHQFEEHAYPGGFQETINTQIFKVYNANVPLNPARVFWINSIIIWLMFPFFAVLGQTVNLQYGLFLPCLGLFNATTHIMEAIVKRNYNPGLLVSVFLNYPTGIYTLHVAHKMGILTVWSGGLAFFLAFIVHLTMFLCAIHWYKSYKNLENA